MYKRSSTNRGKQKSALEQTLN